MGFRAPSSKGLHGGAPAAAREGGAGRLLWGRAALAGLCRAENVSAFVRVLPASGVPGFAEGVFGPFSLRWV